MAGSSASRRKILRTSSIRRSRRNSPTATSTSSRKHGADPRSNSTPVKGRCACGSRGRRARNSLRRKRSPKPSSEGSKGASASSKKKVTEHKDHGHDRRTQQDGIAARRCRSARSNDDGCGAASQRRRHQMERQTSIAQRDSRRQWRDDQGTRFTGTDGRRHRTHRSASAFRTLRFQSKTDLRYAADDGDARASRAFARAIDPRNAPARLEQRGVAHNLLFYARPVEESILDCYRLAKLYAVDPAVFLNKTFSQVERAMYWTRRINDGVEDDRRWQERLAASAPIQLH